MTGLRRRLSLRVVPIMLVAVAILLLGLVAANVSQKWFQSPAASPSVPSPAPSPSAQQTSFPAEANIGVPSSVVLRDYRGQCTLSKANAVIDSTIVSCEPLTIAAPNVTISRSRLGPINVDGDAYSVSIVDSDIDAGGYIGPAVGYSNLTIRTSEIRGGQHSVLCSHECLVEGSLLHDQSLPVGEARHNNAFLSNGGSNIILRHNTFQCTPDDNPAGGGCSADLSLFGDFAAISNVRIEQNLFKASPGAFCIRLGYDTEKQYGNQTTDILVQNNIFERGPGGRCGTIGAATSAPPDLDWNSNYFDDGAVVTPE